jgi:tRNA threonylcarbamoyladenosine modification (KEOPS) complex  Pcc1 subunit
MTKHLELTVVYADAALGEALARHRLALPATHAQPTIERPVHVPGAVGGWFELALNFGVLSLPAGVLAGCIANWITTAIKSRSESPSDASNNSSHRAKLVLQRDGSSVEIELAANDPSALADAIKSALDRVHPQP